MFDIIRYLEEMNVEFKRGTEKMIRNIYPSGIASGGYSLFVESFS